MKFKKDMIVAMAIHADEPILYQALVKSLEGKIKEKELPRLLRYLNDIGVVLSEHTDIGRIYFISTEANSMIGETRELYEEEQKSHAGRVRSLWRRMRK